MADFSVNIYQLSALLAALSWAITGLIASSASRALGAWAFSKLRNVIVFVVLSVIAVVSGGWETIPSDALLPIALSGMIGIFIGDTALFATMNRLGPRSTGILFASNAPLTVLFAWIFLGETLPAFAVFGAIIVFAGIVLAIAGGRPKRPGKNLFEATHGPLWIGVSLGLIAGICQAVGTLLIRPVMDGSDLDPVAVSAIRVGISAFALYVAAMLPIQALKQATPLTGRLFVRTTISGLLAMAIGMTLIVFALSGGEAGVISTLSATTPVLILPLLWIISRDMPRPASWAGAILTIIGSALIFTA